MPQKKYFALIIFFYIQLLACKKEKLSTDLTTNLVIHIPFDNAYKELVQNIEGQNNKSTLVADRKNRNNAAVYFNSADSAFVNFGDIDAASFTNHLFTISFWVKVQDTSSKIAVLSKRNAFGPFEYSIDNFFGNSSFKFDNWRADGGTTVLGFDPLNAEAFINLNQWQHVVFVCNGSELKVYNNTQLQSGTDIKRLEENFSNTDADFVVGNGGGYDRNYFFNGAIDDIRIYNRALSEEDIKALYEE